MIVGELARQKLTHRGKLEVRLAPTVAAESTRAPLATAGLSFTAFSPKHYLKRDRPPPHTHASGDPIAASRELYSVQRKSRANAASA